MARWGASQIYDPKIQDNKLAQWFLKVFGTVNTGSSHLHFMKIVRRAAQEIGFHRVLDAGCGKGQYSFWLAREYPNAEISAFDQSEKKIAYCKAVQPKIQAPNIHFFVGDLLAYKSEGAYDFVYSNHVLEHIAENRLALANLVSCLKEGGIIYIAMPTAVQKRLPFFKRFVESHEEWAKTEHVGQTLTLVSLSSELESLGCKVLLAKHISGFCDELRFELQEMALTYFNSRVLFALLYPLLKLLGIMDTWINYPDGNVIAVLAQKMRTGDNKDRYQVR